MRTRWIAGVVATILVLTGCGADAQPKQPAADTVTQEAEPTPEPAPEPEPEEVSEPLDSPHTRAPQPTAEEPQEDLEDTGGAAEPPGQGAAGPEEPEPSQPPEAAPADPGPTSPAPQPPDPDFDAEWAGIIAGYIVEDIITADERFLDHPRTGGGTTMMFLSGHMEDLLDFGTPPGVDGAEYYALVATLGEFFDRAREELRQDQVMEATATYLTARERTGDLLDMLNPALGTSHQLPPNPFG